MERSAAIRKIEQDMIELARLYQEVAELVQQQEPAVQQINEGANDVVENVDNANKQIGSAIISARNARKWKWYLLLVISKCHVLHVVLRRSALSNNLVLIIAIVVGVAVGVTQANRAK
jgi:syntaxin 1B/2/3